MVNREELVLGLTQREAEKRLKDYGLNQIEKKKKISSFKIFISQFNDFIIWVLIAATIISAITGQKADAITILIIVFMNAILGFIQEFKTEKSLEALMQLAAPTAKVIRDSKLKVINAEELVIGDYIIVESGDRIPADGVLIKDSGFMVDESLLTGESLGVSKTSKDKNNSVFMGTIVLTGKAEVLVTQTGMNTEMGKIANMLQEIENDKSPLKEKLASLGKILVFCCIAICIVVTLVGIWRGEDKTQMFLVGVSLAVAAIPEGLPAIVTVALALGVSRMLKRNALVRKLPAVETLGCTSVICSDKTGTLTQNNMTVKAVYINGKTDFLKIGESFDNLLLKKCFTYCNDCEFDFSESNFKKSLFGDPTETALIKMFYNSSKEVKNFLSKSDRIYSIPFDSDRKLMTVVINEGSKKTCYTKGAPEKLILKCSYIIENGEVKPFTSQYKERVLSAIENMSSNALRCIAAAYKDVNSIIKNELEKNLIFIGLVGMIDPPRVEVKDAVVKCMEAGIKPIMITGDHKNTAFAIGKELSIANRMDEVVTGEELDKMNDKEFMEKIKGIRIFARVNPNHKLRIVKTLKKQGHVVAMTGDGVNDAPAVKEADIGISMGISGTDVTKEASSMILLDDNFATIVAAVEEGRVIYDNIRKFIRYLLSCNLGEVLTMFLSSLFYIETPLLPIQILFVNLLTDGLPAIALGVDPSDVDIMNRKPRKRNENIFSGGLVEKIIIRGCLIGTCTILAFLVGKYYHMSVEACRTLALCTLILSQLIHVFECRSERHSIFEIKFYTNPYLLGAVVISIIMLLIIIYVPFMSSVFHTVPLRLGQWLIIIFFSGTISLINSLYLYIKR